MPYRTFHIIFIVLVSAIAAQYLYIMFLALYGWYKIKYFHAGIKTETVNVSLLIPFYNEERHLPALIESLNKQTLLPLEIIFIDDYSTDNSCRIVEEARSSLPLIHLLKNNAGKGKKEALKAGLNNAKGEWILQTDADCILPERWVETFVLFIANNPETAMINGYVTYSEGKSAWYWFFELEFLSLVFSGAGFTGAGKPVFCNGANMAYKREEVLKLKDAFFSKIPSGDDVFLMQQLAKAGRGKISFLKNNRTVVRTSPPGSFLSFIRQRMRWGSKTPFYMSSFARYVAVMVFITNFFLLFTWAAFFSGLCTWTIPAGLSVLKFIADVPILVSSIIFAGRPRNIAAVIPACVLYPIYVLMVSIRSLSKKVEW